MVTTGSRGRAGRLAFDATSFVDRDEEQREVKRLISSARLVTLAGVGGVGKTRLALRVAEQVQRLFSNGVWQVDLAGLRDGSVLGYALAEMLGIQGTPDRPVGEVLADYVAGRELLLLLDSCEHLLDDCATLAIVLLRAGPAVRVLCTSRQPLGVIGEMVWQVPPLPLPRADGTPDARDEPEPAAVTLFLARARAVAPDFTPTVDSRPVLEEICRRLDGLPLAIELAAAQLRRLSIGQVADGLTDRFSLLSARQAVPEHHRTLRATFDWSFVLCTPREQALWTRLAVFRGSFDLDAVVAVCAQESLPADSMMATLAGLVDKSIVVRDASADPARYRLLDTVREYALDLLHTDSRLEATLSGRHADCQLRRAQRFARTWFGPDQLRLAAAVRDDIDNVRAAFGYYLTTPGQLRSAAWLAVGLRDYWCACGAVGEGGYWLSRILTADPAPTPERVAVLSAYTWVLLTQGDPAAGTVARECLQLARDLDDPLLIAQAGQDLAMHLLISGEDLPGARTLLEDALATYREKGHEDLPRTSFALQSLVLTVRFLGDRERAESLSVEAMALCQAHGDRWYEANAQVVMALVALADGDPDRAMGYLRQALLTRLAFGEGPGIGLALESMSQAAATSGDYERSARLTGAAHRIRHELGQPGYGSAYHWEGAHELDKRARQALGEVKHDAAYRYGWIMSLDDAVRYALGNGPPPQPRPAEPTARSPLTPREQEVAELIAEGLSSRQIAVRLFISQRTAESHTDSIRRKLGFTSRTQIATWVVRQQPP